MNISHDPVRLTFRKKGLPKRLRRIPGGVPGLVSACNVHLAGPEWPLAKVAFFKDRKSMRDFYKKILPVYRSSYFTRGLGRRCGGFCSTLAVQSGCKPGVVDQIELDRRYFCLVAFVEGELTAEVIAHEAVHVGFAWDLWTRGKGPFEDSHNPEENVCYPAGIFVDQVITFIKKEKLREV